MISEKDLEQLKDLILDGLHFDGDHHKQYYLYQAALLLNIDKSEFEGVDEGIPA